MSDSEVDRELVRRVQNGEKEAFDVLVLKYQHKLLKLLSRYIRDSSEVLGKQVQGLHLCLGTQPHILPCMGGRLPASLSLNGNARWLRPL